jgi:hypothetical protein
MDGSEIDFTDRKWLEMAQDRAQLRILSLRDFEPTGSATYYI